MPIQAPQWTDYLNCPACCREFAPPRSPISLVCGHTLCRQCINNLHRRQCPFDQTDISVVLEELVTNTALLQLAGYPPPSQPYHPPCVQALAEADRLAYDVIVKCLEQLAVFLKYCGSASASGCRLSRPMQRKLVTLLQCAMTDEDGRGKAARAARSLGERTVTELILQHQNPQQLSANLWAAVRARGCQFLGPAMQEEVLKLVLLALEDGSALSRKVLVMFVVQRLEPHFPQASKTSIGHVVQLLYRASCFKVSKRERDSSLMQLKEEFRTYETLRREHDAQIVQIATEAGLRIAPDQWSALLYGDTQHKSHMQSIIDKLQTPQSFSQSVQELFIALQRTGDPAQLIVMSIPLDRLASIDASPDANSPTWQQLGEIMTALKEVVSGLVHYMQLQNGRDASQKILERLAESPGQPMLQGGAVPGRYKVAMCRDAQARAYCPRGNNCTYAHSEEELERYRRINHAVNNYPIMLPVTMAPAVTVSRPIYQRYDVPPPAIAPIDNYNVAPAVQPQLVPSPRRSVIGADDQREDITYEQPIPMQTREPQQPYEPSYEMQSREQPAFEHPPPNVADNFTTSYAGVLMHGNDAMSASPRPNQSPIPIQAQNGNMVAMPQGCFYSPFYQDRTYPYMPAIDNEADANRMKFGRGVVTGPVDNNLNEYAPQAYTEEFTQIKSYAEDYPAPIYGDNGQAGERHHDYAFGMQARANQEAWQTKKNVMFEFTELAKNLPLPQTNGDANVMHGIDTLRIGAGALNDIGGRADVERAEVGPDEQQLEKELLALEQRISTEFSRTSDTDPEE